MKLLTITQVKVGETVTQNDKTGCRATDDKCFSFWENGREQLFIETLLDLNIISQKKLVYECS